MNTIILILIVGGIAWFFYDLWGQKRNRTPFASDAPDYYSPERKHMREAIKYARTNFYEIQMQNDREKTLREKHASTRVDDLDKLNGEAFEAYLEGLFRVQGYDAKKTPVSGDFGADLILSREGERIAVQAKRYIGSVGVSAVQEALSGMAYYNCQSAMVVTTGYFTKNAIELAKKSEVRMIDRVTLGNWMAQSNHG